LFGFWGLGLGLGGLGLGVLAQTPKPQTPNPKSPIPNPHCKKEKIFNSNKKF